MRKKEHARKIKVSFQITTVLNSRMENVPHAPRDSSSTQRINAKLLIPCAGSLILQMVNVLHVMLVLRSKMEIVS